MPRNASAKKEAKKEAPRKAPRKEPAKAAPADDLPEVGARVLVGDRPGTVRFTGEVQFARGAWVGVELDAATGKHDGEVKGVRYFTCPDQRGVFVRPEAVELAPLPNLFMAGMGGLGMAPMSNMFMQPQPMPLATPMFGAPGHAVLVQPVALPQQPMGMPLQASLLGAPLALPSVLDPGVMQPGLLDPALMQQLAQQQAAAQNPVIQSMHEQARLQLQQGQQQAARQLGGQEESLAPTAPTPKAAAPVARERGIPGAQSLVPPGAERVPTAPALAGPAAAARAPLPADRDLTTLHPAMGAAGTYRADDVESLASTVLKSPRSPDASPTAAPPQGLGEKLRELKRLAEEGLLTPAEYEEHRSRALAAYDHV